MVKIVKITENHTNYPLAVKDIMTLILKWVTKFPVDILYANFFFQLLGPIFLILK